ncbi:methylated-DNA--[protein]-cysteine S-methyltransferase [Falsiporphyromonas endometrii]|uniref:Methylated-DNA--[protein]-cysteine S-methyltransferase n=1 Tax=Falsiporphyromonas endometrii TaxID=1387297 RepID=A0ABV9K9S3_9PORP
MDNIDFNERSWMRDGLREVLSNAMTSLFYAKSTFQYIILSTKEYSQLLLDKRIETTTVLYLQTLWKVYSYEDAIIKIEYIRNYPNRIGLDTQNITEIDTPPHLTKDLSQGAILFLQAAKAQKERKTNPKLILSGTPLQIETWKALELIPYGKVVSYTDIAILVHRPKAVRAIANAISKNPLAPILPCHRVIRSNGDIGGYAFGKTEKAKILTLEICNTKRKY